MTDRLPDFHIPLDEKISWMVETKGYAVEPVAARHDTDPPLAGYVYTIGFPEAFDGFPDLVVFGLAPAAASGLFDLVASMLRGGTEIPIGVALTGLFDDDLRCLFGEVDMAEFAELFGTGIAYRRGAPSRMVQLLWPDRNGFLPTELGFDRTRVLAQPVIART
ncbi:MAG: DUF4262 domain-containing protein [Ilumatobacteraceae bacterium]